MKLPLFGGASRFAHLAGIVALDAARADDGDDKDKTGKRSRARAEDDDDKEDKTSKRSRADDGDDDEDKKDAKGSRARADDDDDDDDGARAEDDDDKEDKTSKRSRADDGDDDEDEPKSKKSRRARADEDEDDDRCEDDDDKDEMHGRSAAANARRRERARCAAIFDHPAAAGNAAMAASLAFETTMTRKEAIKVLKSNPARPEAADARSDERSDRNARLSPGGAPQSGSKSVEASWATAIDKVTVPRRK